MENNNNFYLATETTLFNYLSKLLLIISESEQPLEVKNRVRYEVLVCFELHGLAHVNTEGKLVASPEIKNVIFNIFYYSNLGQLFDKYPSLTNDQNTLKGKECLNDFLAILMRFSDIAKELHSVVHGEIINKDRIPLVIFKDFFPETDIIPTDMLVKNCYINSFHVESPNQLNNQFRKLTALSDSDMFQYIQSEYNTFYIISNFVDKIILNYKANEFKPSRIDYNRPSDIAPTKKTSWDFNEEENDLNYRLYEEEKKSENNKLVIITIAVFCAPIILGGVYNQNIFFTLMGIALGVFIYSKWHV
ncbi:MULTISPECIES: hypothetical protein [Morganellaceae]|uniref:hypothetical protein n=1 Tax=Morganellaceae TaxID=1903414 RepID=UPI001C7E0D52|nr:MULTISPECIES: hypothetical protein [Morganellaceae]